MKPFRPWMVPIFSLLALGALPATASADPAADRKAITERLHGWAAAFNTRDASAVCELFAPDLVATVPGALDGDRPAVCKRLAALLLRPDLELHYAPDIHEIIIAGDLAVVRLFWTLTMEKDGQRATSREAGMDIFERQPDGRWAIARFLAFPIAEEEEK